MRIKSPEKMKQILQFINAYYAKTKQSPSIREIADFIGLAPSNALEYVLDMNERGMLTYRGGRRGIKTKYMKPQSASMIPLVGEIACGEPLLVEENIEDYISISSILSNSENCFALRAKGDSMINIGIADGDVVIVRKQSTANEGQVVVALIDGCEATLKRFFYDAPNHRYRLHPENDDMEDMYYEDVAIQGIVVKVIKDVI